MGQSHSQSAFEKAVASALGNNSDLYAFPSSPSYLKDSVKIYNLDIPTTPLAVVFPKTVSQISALVKLAAANNLKVQGKSGGHSYANFGNPNGGIVVDLKYFQKFEIDTKTWECKVGAGTLLGDLTKRMYEPHKRAMAHGTCPEVGIGGHATIGGLGPSSRLFGAALDHIMEVEVVTATGKIIRANEKENSDIFWAVKGAGASFGIVTEFVCRTEPAPGSAVHYSYSLTTGSWKDMSTTFQAWQRYVAQKDLSWKLASMATITEAGLAFSGTYYGTQEEYNVIASAPEFPGNQFKTKTLVFRDYLGLVGHWAEEAGLEIGGGLSAHSYTKTLTFNHCDLIPASVIDKVFQYFEDASKGTLIWFVIFDLAGGQINAIAHDATAYAHRDALFYMQSYAVNAFGTVTETTKSFLRGLNTTIYEGMKAAGENTDWGAYAGYVDLELPHPQQSYWRTNLPRLEEIKRKWDAGDVFHNPQSVLPGGVEVKTEAKVVVGKGGVVEKEGTKRKLKGFFA